MLKYFDFKHFKLNFDKKIEMEKVFFKSSLLILLTLQLLTSGALGNFLYYNFKTNKIIF